MTLQTRDRRAVLALGIAGLVTAAVYFWPASDASIKVVAPRQSVESAEQRLTRMRQLAATVPGKQEALKRIQAELAVREKGLIQADTTAQAQAQLLQIMRRVGKAQPQPIDIRGNEIGQVKPFGDSYGEVLVAVNMECRIDQLVNLLADITAQPELIATSEVRIGGAQGREKVIPVRLTISGIVPKKLLPQKKGTSQF
jgi:hypothetical protein